MHAIELEQRAERMADLLKQLDEALEGPYRDNFKDWLEEVGLDAQFIAAVADADVVLS